MVLSGAQYQANSAEEDKGERKQFTPKTEYEEDNCGTLSGFVSPTPSNLKGSGSDHAATTTSSSVMYVPGLPVTQPSSYSSNKATSDSDHNGRNSTRSGENASPRSVSRQASSARSQQPGATPVALSTASAAHASVSTGNHYWSHHGPNPAAYNGAANRGYHHGNNGYGQNHGHHLQPPNGSYNKENNHYYGMGNGYNQNGQVNQKRQHYNVATHQYRWGYIDDTLDDIPPPRVRGNTTNAQMKARQQQQSEQYWYAANSYYHNSNHWSDDAPPGDEPIQLEKPLETMSQPVVGRLYHQQLFSRGKQLLETLPTSKKRPDFTAGRRGSPSPQDQEAMDAITSKLSETRVEQKQAEMAAATAAASAAASARAVARATGLSPLGTAATHGDHPVTYTSENNANAVPSGPTPLTESDVANRMLGRAPPPAPAPLDAVAGTEVDKEHADPLHTTSSEEVTPHIRITRPSGDLLSAVPSGVSAPGLNRGAPAFHPQHQDLQDSKGSLVGSLCSSMADGASGDGKKGFDIALASDEFADCLSDGSCDEITYGASGPMGWFESPSSPSEQSNSKNSPRPIVK